MATEATAVAEASHGHKRTISAVTSPAEREVEKEEAAQGGNGGDINVENATGSF